MTCRNLCHKPQRAELTRLSFGVVRHAREPTSNPQTPTSSSCSLIQNSRIFNGYLVLGWHSHACLRTLRDKYVFYSTASFGIPTYRTYPLHSSIRHVMCCAYSPGPHMQASVSGSKHGHKTSRNMTGRCLETTMKISIQQVAVYSTLLYLLYSTLTRK